MKFIVQMKDPDVLQDAIAEAVTESLEDIADEDERAAILDVRTTKVSSIAAKWFEYGEYLRVEIDTDAGTCIVLPVSR